MHSRTLRKDSSRISAKALIQAKATQTGHPYNPGTSLYQYIGDGRGVSPAKHNIMKKLSSCDQASNSKIGLKSGINATYTVKTKCFLTYPRIMTWHLV